MEPAQLLLTEHQNGTATLEADVLAEYADIAGHFISTRRGGSSRPPYQGLNIGLHVGDDPGTVIANRRALFEDAMGVSLGTTVFQQQIHDRNVATVVGSDAGRGALDVRDAFPATDSMVSDSTGVCLCVLVADCAPILAIDPAGTAIGLAHAGWKGTLRGVAVAMVEAMQESCGSTASDLIVLLGPSISPDVYEVRDDVLEEAQRVLGPAAETCIRWRNGKSYFDVPMANEVLLTSCGVKVGNIFRAPVTTNVVANELFSERMEGRPCGRFVAAMWLK